MRVMYAMPSFTQEHEARAIGEACGLKLVQWKKIKGGFAATFSCETQEAIEKLTADLSYGPEAFWQDSMLPPRRWS